MKFIPKIKSLFRWINVIARFIGWITIGWLLRLIGKLTFLQLLLIVLVLVPILHTCNERALHPPGLQQSIKRFERQRQQERGIEDLLDTDKQQRALETGCADGTTRCAERIIVCWYCGDGKIVPVTF